MRNIGIATNREEFREWLREHASVETGCWIEVRRDRPVDDGVFYYLDAVEEPLCFGWIDSIHKEITDMKELHDLREEKISRIG